MTKFEREIFHNRDKKYKLSLIYHIQYIFELNNIDEKVVGIIPTEYIDAKFSQKRMDFAVECESGNIYDIECETSTVDENTSNKTWNYVKALHWKYENNIYSLIIALSEKNKNPKKQIGTTTHNPILFEIKKLDGNKHLNNIKKKFESEEELTNHDCAIIETIPDMKNTQKIDIIVEELCYIIKYGKINMYNRRILQATMWLNIDYYVKNKEKRKKLMEMIDVEKSLNSEFVEWQKENRKEARKEGMKEGRKEGRNEREREIIFSLLNYMKPEEIAKKTGISLKKINRITGK